jgi:secreted trypsin-like serine protease
MDSAMQVQAKLLAAIKPRPAIAGGSHVEPIKFEHDYSWMAAVTIGAISANAGSEPLFLFGATHIGDGWYLTAAHCVVNNSGQKYAGRYLKVLHGSHELALMQVAQVQDVYAHPCYRDASSGFDVAILYAPGANLAAKAAINRDNSEPLVSTCVRILGWGSTEDSLYAVPSLKFGDQIVTSIESCAERMKQRELAALQNMATMISTCTATSSVCDQDSGGPLIANIEGKIVQVGIISFKTNDSCCPSLDEYNGHTRIACFADWIDDVMKHHSGGVCE